MNNRSTVALLLMRRIFKFGQKKYKKEKKRKNNNRSKVALLLMRPTFNFSKLQQLPTPQDSTHLIYDAIKVQIYMQHNT